MTDGDGQRFLLETFSDGGLLLDLVSGDFFRLNHSANFVWERRLDGIDPHQIVLEMAARFQLPEQAAAKDVADTLALAVSAGARADLHQTWYELVGDHDLFSVNGAPALEIAASGNALRATGSSPSPDLKLHLKAVSPKLLALLGESVLHASAVRYPDGGLLVFVGESGAGKTTTARAFAAAGLALISEDKVLVHRRGEILVARLDGERCIDEWLGEIQRRLREQGPGAWIAVPALDGETAPPAATGTAAIAQILVLEAARREGNEIRLRPLGGSEVAAEICRHAFYGSSTTPEWRRTAGIAAIAGRTIPTAAATMPAGLGALAEAAKRYTLTTQS